MGRNKKVVEATKITIQKNVPLPVNATGRGRKNGSKYPFADMKVGDSFFLPVLYERIYNLGWNYRKGQKKAGKNWDFAAAKEGKGSRIWRTK